MLEIIDFCLKNVLIPREQEEEIIIRCHEEDEEIRGMVHRLQTDTLVLLGYQNERVHRIKLRDIYYFEAVDGKVFIYCRSSMYEVKQKLYELEALCSRLSCFRASKSTVLNIAKISMVRPAFSGRFEAVLDNGEHVVISRQYVPILKNMLGL